MDREDLRKAIQKDLKGEPFRELLRDIWLDKGYEESEIAYPVEIHATAKWSPQQFPCGEISVGWGRKDTPDQALAEYNYQVTIFWHANGDDEDWLEDVLDRLVRATQDFYKSRPQITTRYGGANIWLGDNDPSPLIHWGEENRPYIKSMAQELYAKVIR